MECKSESLCFNSVGRGESKKVNEQRSDLIRDVRSEELIQQWVGRGQNEYKARKSKG